MIEPRTMHPEECSPWPPALLFTPEVPGNHHSTAELEFGPGWDSDPADWHLELLADDILENSPDLARFLLNLEGV